jgi:Flp pilus assembly protein TadG
MKRIFTSHNQVRDFSHRRRIRQQRGSIMLLTSVLIVGMIGMLALSIDLGFLFSARNQFQNGIDAATLAAGTALRVTIEADPAAPQQTLIAQELAVQFAGYNQVRRYTDPDPDSGEPNANNIVLASGNVVVDTGADIPKVRINTLMTMPLLFAGLFGFNSMDMGAAATASLLPVDGGTGTIGAGTATGAGCWRPLLLPDTFYDLNDQPRIVGGDIGGIARIPDQAGDYYRSRFAAGGRNAYPFVDSFSGARASVTSLRDTPLQAEIGTKTIMGQEVIFRSNFYFIANLSGLPRATFDVLSPGDLANFGYCGNIRVGDDIPVYPLNDLATYDQVRTGLLALKYRTLDSDSIDPIAETQYRYVKSSSYPGPNTHGAIIPVLFYNPILMKDHPNLGAITTLKVTNIGLFFLKDVDANGHIRGYFVREVIAGGTPIDSTNMTTDSCPSPPDCNFKRSWLPMSVQLQR